jgi:hypothetical protein
LDNRIPDVPACAAVGGLVSKANFAARLPAFWNSCGSGTEAAKRILANIGSADTENIGEAVTDDLEYLCASSSRAYCDNVTRQCVNKADKEAEGFDENLDYGYLKYAEKKAEACWFDLDSFEKGTLPLELELWNLNVHEGLETMSEHFQSFNDQLKAKIDQMNSGAHNSDLGMYAGEVMTLTMPQHCPAPPKISLPPVAGACVDASSAASQISNTVAVLDGHVLDHQMAVGLQGKNYKLYGEAKTCRNGESFPCNETLLAHHPSGKHSTLECFKQKKITGEINIEHKCFEGTLTSSYFGTYVARSIQTAEKWIKVLGEKVYPGRKCRGFIRGPNGEQGTLKIFEDDQMAFQECKFVGVNRRYIDEQICGSVGCCANAFATTGGLNFGWVLQSNNNEATVAGTELCPVDTVKGAWKLITKGDECTTEQCDLSQFSLKIVWRYEAEYKNGVRSSEVSISTENDIVIGTTDQEIIDGLTKAGRPATDICKMNQQLGKRCGLSVDKQSVHYCQRSECCMPDNTSPGAYKCRSNNGNNCFTTSNLRYNFSKHVICLEQNSTETNQAEILPGSLTQAGEDAPLVDGIQPAVPVDVAADQATVPA